MAEITEDLNSLSLSDLTEKQVKTKLRNAMVKKGTCKDELGNLLPQEDWTAACHKYSVKQATEQIMSGKYTEAEIAEIIDFTSSSDNLRIQATAHNKQHSKKEREIASTPSNLSHESTLRVEATIQAIDKTDKLPTVKEKFFRLSFGNIQTKKGEKLVDRKLRKGDMRQKATRESVVVTADRSPTKPLQFTSKGEISKQSPLVKSGDVLLRADGKVDGRSRAVKRDEIKFTSSGDVDKRSSAARSSYTGSGSSNSNSTYVSSYTRSNGTTVKGYYRK